MITYQDVELYLMRLKSVKPKKIAGISVLCFMSLIGSGCDRQDDIAEELGRPKTPTSCLANDDGTCFRNGREIQVENMECIESHHSTDLQEYVLKLERKYYKCSREK